ncbi:hypothetical protein [Solicola sp. PLA-1-18]|uniref:hypothetical protein n=1 Tax=Solicola sp. PLA-1-18 TaxID=3380532 RepID=UPI003B7E6760
MVWNAEALLFAIPAVVTGVLAVVFGQRLTRWSDRFEGRERTDDEVRRHARWGWLGLAVSLVLAGVALFTPIFNETGQPDGDSGWEFIFRMVVVVVGFGVIGPLAIRQYNRRVNRYFEEDETDRGEDSGRRL